jgi:hypothetical protein
MRTIEDGRYLQLTGGYFDEAHNSVDGLIAEAREILADVDYDTMVGRGLSGAVIVPILARELGKRWMIVRKPKDGSHSFRNVEGTLGHRWLFVDDFIAGGGTRRATMEGIAEAAVGNNWTTEYVGDYQYAYRQFEPARRYDGGLYSGSGDKWDEILESKQEVAREADRKAEAILNL